MSVASPSPHASPKGKEEMEEDEDEEAPLAHDTYFAQQQQEQPVEQPVPMEQSSPMDLGGDDIDDLFPEEPINIPSYRTRTRRQETTVAVHLYPTSVTGYYNHLLSLACPSDKKMGPFPFFAITVHTDSSVSKLVYVPRVQGLISAAFAHVCSCVQLAEAIVNQKWTLPFNERDFLPWLMPVYHMYKEFCNAARSTTLAQEAEVGYNLVVAQHQSDQGQLFVHVWRSDRWRLSSTPEWVRTIEYVVSGFGEQAFDHQRVKQTATAATDLDFTSDYFL